MGNKKYWSWGPSRACVQAGSPLYHVINMNTRTWGSPYSKTYLVDWGHVVKKVFRIDMAIRWFDVIQPVYYKIRNIWIRDRSCEHHLCFADLENSIDEEILKHDPNCYVFSAFELLVSFANKVELVCVLVLDLFTGRM